MFNSIHRQRSVPHDVENDVIVFLRLPRDFLKANILEQKELQQPVADVPYSRVFGAQPRFHQTQALIVIVYFLQRFVTATSYLIWTPKEERVEHGKETEIVP